ncbi:hypothetical protein FNV43_RR12493 [Rhamnella rubrinervis]|uniref:Secreted protein n=1 Tax=Rhamnella rubrinervis TaxID=2594499 RepID=A0A8K0H7Z3_9ROSA|nr:hypothetical protein FNV43_RR12493 [Rhamnella rubrinervis]
MGLLELGSSLIVLCVRAVAAGSSLKSCMGSCCPSSQIQLYVLERVGCRLHGFPWQFNFNQGRTNYLRGYLMARRPKYFQVVNVSSKVSKNYGHIQKFATLSTPALLRF